MDITYAFPVISKSRAFMRSKVMSLAFSGLIGLFMPYGWAQEELVPVFHIDDPTHIAIPSASSLNADQGKSTSTGKVMTIPGLYRYPRGTINHSTIINGIRMDNKLALRSDVKITFWFRLDPPWDGIEESWNIEFFKPDGSPNGKEGGISWRYYLEEIDGTTQHCFEAFGPAPDQIRDKFCRSNNLWLTVYLGVAWYPVSWASPLGSHSVDFTHNGELERSDKYFLSDVELLNPNPSLQGAALLDFDGGITDNWNRIFNTGAEVFKVSFAATDGLTPLILRAGTLPEIPVTFRISSQDARNGTLISLDEAEGPATAVTPNLFETSHEETFAGAIYTVPEEFPGSFTDSERPVNFEVQFDMPDGEGGVAPVVHTLQLKLIRPPLVLIHGMWSSPAAWVHLLGGSELEQTRNIRTISWAPARTGLFDNIGRVKTAGRDFIHRLRNQSIAVTQVDVIAHSAGGQLARLWAQENDYRRVDNLKQGDFHKLITIGTPHQGSWLGDFVVDLVNANSAAVDYGDKFFRLIGNRSVQDDIIEDQRTVGNEALSTLEPTPIPSQAWVGHIGMLPEDSVEEDMWWALFLACHDPAVPLRVEECRFVPNPEFLRGNVFRGLPNDGIVQTDSQAGNLSIGSQVWLSDSLHAAQTSHMRLISELQTFLDGRFGFDGYGFP